MVGAADINSVLTGPIKDPTQTQQLLWLVDETPHYFQIFQILTLSPHRVCVPQGPCTGNQQSLAHSRLWDAVVGFLHVFAHMMMKLAQVR